MIEIDKKTKPSVENGSVRAEMDGSWNSIVL